MFVSSDIFGTNVANMILCGSGKVWTVPEKMGGGGHAVKIPGEWNHIVLIGFGELARALPKTDLCRAIGCGKFT